MTEMPAICPSRLIKIEESVIPRFKGRTIRVTQICGQSVNIFEAAFTSDLPEEHNPSRKIPPVYIGHGTSEEGSVLSLLNNWRDGVERRNEMAERSQSAWPG